MNPPNHISRIRLADHTRLDSKLLRLTNCRTDTRMSIPLDQVDLQFTHYPYKMQRTGGAYATAMDARLMADQLCPRLTV
jgi:hypothetical protein